MESLGTAVLDLVANVAPLSAGLKEGQVEAEKMSRTTSAGLRGGIGKAALVAGAALGVVAVGLHHAVDAAQEDQVAQAKLNKAFTDAGVNVADYRGKIDEAVASSASLGFRSQDVKGALASLVTATGSGTQALQLLSAAQDLARYKNVDLATATKVLTGTMAGSTRAAHTLGITIVPVTAHVDALKAKTQYATLAQYEAAKQTASLADKQATAAKTIQLVTDKLGGQAQAYANTAEGAKAKMGAELQLLEENIGKMLLPALTAVSGALATATEWMTEHSTVAKIVIAVVAGLALGILALTLAIKANNLIVAASKIEWLSLNTVMEANPIMLVATALAILGTALYVAWTKSQTFRDIVKGVFGDIKAAADAFVSFFTQKIPAAFEDVKSWVAAHWPEIATLIAGPFAPIVALATNAFGVRSKLLGAFNDILQGGKTLETDIINTFEGIGSGIANAVKSAINWLIGLLDAIHITIGKVSILGQTIFPGLDWHPFHIPMLADGGIVSRPTLAMIGERGPEAVVPLSKGAGMGVTVNVTGVVGNPRDVAVTIGRELQKLQARGMSFGLS